MSSELNLGEANWHCECCLCQYGEVTQGTLESLECWSRVLRLEKFFIQKFLSTFGFYNFLVIDIEGPVHSPTCRHPLLVWEWNFQCLLLAIFVQYEEVVDICDSGEGHGHRCCGTWHKIRRLLTNAGLERGLMTMKTFPCLHKAHIQDLHLKTGWSHHRPHINLPLRHPHPPSH